MGIFDTDIYKNIQAPDVSGGFEKGLKMSDLIKARRNQSTMQDIVKGAVTTNPDGTLSYDNSAIAGRAAQAGLLDEAQKYQGLGQAQSNKDRDYKLQMNHLQNQIDDRKDAREERRSLVGLQLEDRRDARFQAAQSREDANAEKVARGDFLPLDQKQMVSGLATKNASKTAIANQIDSVISTWDTLPEDQKVTQGRQLIKVLNSTEGADAVGSEEAKRLGGKLEFAMGNLTNSNPFQLGRDLDGFKEQASLTSKGIRGAVRANQAQVDAMMGRQAPMTTGATHSDSDAIKWALANPDDKRSMAILKANNYSMKAAR